MLDATAVANQPSSLSNILDIVDKGAKIIALFIGGAWAYLNYRRGRTFTRRLEPKISGKTSSSKGALLLTGVAQVKNVGLSKVTIEQRGTAIEVLAVAKQPNGKKLPLQTSHVAVLPVFEVHRWVEPGEMIEESFLLLVPDQFETVAFRLRLRIVSNHLEWNCDSIVEIVADYPTAADKTRASAAQKG